MGIFVANGVCFRVGAISREVELFIALKIEVDPFTRDMATEHEFGTARLPRLLSDNAESALPLRTIIVPPNASKTSENEAWKRGMG